MCGIVGLHLRGEPMVSKLGELVVPMLEALTSRGPDSAGIAIYDDQVPVGHRRYSLRAPRPDYPWEQVVDAIEGRTGRRVKVETRANMGLMSTELDPTRVTEVLGQVAPDIVLVGRGAAMTLFKDTGSPRTICERYGLYQVSGYQAVGHTRMATESAVTTDHSHPFSPSEDLALVHNGSFSNHNTIRRWLERGGVVCDTDNDSEVCARFIGARLAQGEDLEEALRQVQKEFDGFYTLLVATRTQFAVARDAFACKPLVVAETADYVAVASEYHALAELPGIDEARVYEPMPEEVHTWTR